MSGGHFNYVNGGFRGAVMAEDLKSCPFCGGEMIDEGTEEYGAFYHLDPDAARKKKCPLVVKHFKSRTKAIEAWNTRAERTCRNLGKDLTCSECGANVCGGSFRHSYCDSVGTRWYTTKNPPSWNYCPNCGAKVVEQ